MADSLKFGTSGLRGLAVDLIGAPSAWYTRAFLASPAVRGSLAPGGDVLVGRDLRRSSPAIAASVMGAIAEAGYRPVDCGEVSTPAVAHFAMGRAVPAIMVTGSHIPADRNGLKFYRPSGEITKDDEAGIAESLAKVGRGSAPSVSGEAAPQARAAYLARYAVFRPDSLAGMSIGVFQHSSVLRDDLVTALESLGALVVPLGRENQFVPIDTEALSAEVVAQARRWVAAHRLDALVSTDGDADRPLVADERGAFVRGDVVGMLTARFLGADAVVTPVTSNSAIEGLGFARVVRTKVGSPYVIAGMDEAKRAGARVVVGFEANGGVLLGTPVMVDGGRIEALPTRDALLPILTALVVPRRQRMTVSQLVATLPTRVARSDRLEHVPQEKTAAFLARLADPAFAARYFAEAGEIAGRSDIDGLRFALASGDVVHYRGSGNAPELRCYTEAATAERADALLAWGLEAAEREVR